MAMEHSPGATVHLMSDNLFEIKKKVAESTSGQMEGSTKVNGLMGNNMATDAISNQINLEKRVAGKMAKLSSGSRKAL